MPMSESPASLANIYPNLYFGLNLYFKICREIIFCIIQVVLAHCSEKTLKKLCLPLFLLRKANKQTYLKILKECIISNILVKIKGFQGIHRRQVNSCPCLS